MDQYLLTFIDAAGDDQEQVILADDPDQVIRYVQRYFEGADETLFTCIRVVDANDCVLLPESGNWI